MVDPRTPVVVGVGQAAERIDDAYYRGMSAVELAAAGARRRSTDCGADAAKRRRVIDTVAGIRQFEISGPAKPVWASRTTTRGRWRSRIGADPGPGDPGVLGGQGPQHLITELAGAIAARPVEVAMLFGSDATST